jgi:hypothetical protein
MENILCALSIFNTRDAYTGAYTEGKVITLKAPPLALKLAHIFYLLHHLTLVKEHNSSKAVSTSIIRQKG